MKLWNSHLCEKIFFKFCYGKTILLKYFYAVILNLNICCLIFEIVHNKLEALEHSFSFDREIKKFLTFNVKILQYKNPSMWLEKPATMKFSIVLPVGVKNKKLNVNIQWRYYLLVWPKLEAVMKVQSSFKLIFNLLKVHDEELQSFRWIMMTVNDVWEEFCWLSATLKLLKLLYDANLMYDLIKRTLNLSHSTFPSKEKQRQWFYFEIDRNQM